MWQRVFRGPSASLSVAGGSVGHTCPPPCLHLAACTLPAAEQVTVACDKWQPREQDQVSSSISSPNAMAFNRRNFTAGVSPVRCSAAWLQGAGQAGLFHGAAVLSSSRQKDLPCREEVWGRGWFLGASSTGHLSPCS